MTKYLLSVIYILILITMYSCEDVVDIELDTFEENLVVDAWINDLPGDKTIVLSQTANYFESARTPKLSDASVIVTRNATTDLVFESVGEGRYVYNGEIGNPGDSYELNIDLGGQQYCATSEMKRVPTVDSIDVEFLENELIIADGLYTQFFARDFDGIGDAYWIKTFKNGVFRDNPREMNIVFDAGFDAGTGIDGIIFIPPIRELMNPVDDEFLPIPWEVGEMVKVEIHSITKDAFQWMEIARDQMLNGDNSIFALPVTNTRGNISNCDSENLALGFFNVAAVSSREKQIE